MKSGQAFWYNGIRSIWHKSKGKTLKFFLNWCKNIVSKHLGTMYLAWARCCKLLPNVLHSSEVRWNRARSSSTTCFTGVNFISIHDQLFCVKVVCKVFLLLQFGFVIYWRMESGTKTAHKMLTKLATGANFINILWAAFFLKSVMQNFCVLIVCVCVFFCQ